MSGEYGYIVRLLRKVEFSLADLGRQREAGKMGQISQKIANADDVRGALGSLARVDGYERMALRLLFYADTMGPLLEEAPDDELTEYHVGQLVSDLSPEEMGEGSEPTRGPLSPDLVEGAESFIKGVHALRELLSEQRSETESRLLFEELTRQVKALARLASKEERNEIERFASSTGVFLRFATDRALLGDIRVVNILDNASLALHAILPSAGGDDYDSLAQTTRLLADPATLLE